MPRSFETTLENISTHLRIGCERLVDAATKPGVKRVPVRSGYADGFDYYSDMIADEFY